jgi:Ca-activated chloride channel family protein
MELKCTVNPYIPVTNQRHLVYALVEMVPGKSEPQVSAPLNVGLVVDASESMSIPILTEAQFQDLLAKGMAKQKEVDGVKVWQFEVPRGYKVEAPSNLDFTKQALRIVANRLRPEDRFSLIAFAEDALLMVPNTPGHEKAKLLQAIDRLDRAELGDETYMARGMAMGHKQTLPGIAPHTVSRMIVLTDGYTKEKQACHSWAQQAKQDGIVVSTMGLGLDFNEELLISLADASGGHAYFCQDPAQIPEVLEEELTCAQSITWRNMSLSLTLPTDVTLRRAHRASPTIAHIPANPDKMELGDLEPGQPPAVLLEMIVPPRPVGNYRLAQAALHARPATGGGSQEIAQRDIVVSYTERPSEASQTDPLLMSAVQRVSAFKLQNQAMEEAGRGNVAGATRRLRMAGERLIDMGQKDLGETMLSEAERMEHGEQMSVEGTKKLRYGTRKLTRPPRADG